MDYHIQIYKGEKYFVGICEEIPGAMTQGKTVDEVKENMKDAIELIRKPVIMPEFSGQTPMRETIVI
jgi:predicted RNase H-like HicB family nuclease